MNLPWVLGSLSFWRYMKGSFYQDLIRLLSFSPSLIKLNSFFVSERPWVLANRRTDIRALLCPQILSRCEEVIRHHLQRHLCRDRVVREGAGGRAGGEDEGEAEAGWWRLWQLKVFNSNLNWICIFLNSAFSGFDLWGGLGWMGWIDSIKNLRC